MFVHEQHNLSRKIRIERLRKRGGNEVNKDTFELNEDVNNGDSTTNLLQYQNLISGASPKREETTSTTTTTSTTVTKKVILFNDDSEMVDNCYSNISNAPTIEFNNPGLIEYEKPEIIKNQQLQIEYPKENLHEIHKVECKATQNRCFSIFHYLCTWIKLLFKGLIIIAFLFLLLYFFLNLLSDVYTTPYYDNSILVY